MKFTMPDAVLYPLEGHSPEEALAKTTHMAVAAHQDDIEIMAFDGVMACFQQPDKWFTGVVVTNGAGSRATASMPVTRTPKWSPSAARSKRRRPWSASTPHRRCSTCPVRPQTMC